MSLSKVHYIFFGQTCTFGGWAGKIYSQEGPVRGTGGLKLLILSPDGSLQTREGKQILIFLSYLRPVSRTAAGFVACPGATNRVGRTAGWSISPSTSGGPYALGAAGWSPSVQTWSAVSRGPLS